ncbi:MAG: 3-methyladenine DNA glycosylase [Balneolaceae bacterium]
MPDSIQHVLPAGKWTSMQEHHRQVLAEILNPYLEKRSRQIKDPVVDFLFEYYAFRPARLQRWSPGFGAALDPAGEPWPELSELSVSNGFARLDPTLFPGNRLSSLRWILKLLKESVSRTPSFGCLGMHEWAMVYRAENVRHDEIPLRLSGKEIAEFVESRPLLCTHFDAYRFFTSKARPMNRHTLSRENFHQNEQPGCIHTNMDLYKWAFKMYPWISSEIIREAFLLALEARYFDMQASPYDLCLHGLRPIKIETEAGRIEYAKKQKQIFEKSQPLRRRLIESYQQLADHFLA